jgi:hypothetical protein
MSGTNTRYDTHGGEQEREEKYLTFMDSKAGLQLQLLPDHEQHHIRMSSWHQESCGCLMKSGFCYEVFGEHIFLLQDSSADGLWVRFFT